VRARSSFAPSWWRVFLVGLALWIASVVVTAITGNLNLVPTVVLLGSFLVPVTAVMWYLDHYESPTLAGRDVLNGFLIGGVLGVLAASVLEWWLLSGGALAYVLVGFIEEGAKLVALLFVAWRIPHERIRDGIVLGAAVGFGFAALESSGYALTALLSTASSGSLSLGALVGTEVFRGVLAPLGHGLWTAILGGVVFASARGGRLRLRSKALLAAYAGVSLLHSLWDSMRGIALVLTALMSASPLRAARTPQGVVLEPSAQQAQLFTEVELGGFALISLLGLAWLAILWRRSRAAVEPRVASRPEVA
jgi:RsiW-degrading membrane proteinase PrsW (M82 family)